MHQTLQGVHSDWKSWKCWTSWKSWKMSLFQNLAGKAGKTISFFLLWMEKLEFYF